MQTLNQIASFLIMSSSLCLLFRHYADHNSRFEKVLSKYFYLAFKLLLVVMAMGTLWNIFKSTPTPTSEIVLNVGLAGFMLLMCYVFDKIFLCKKDKFNRTIDPTCEDYPDDTES